MEVKDNMKQLLGWGIAAVGGYFLLQHFGIDLLGSGTTATGTTTTPQANDNTANGTGVTASATATAILAMVAGQNYTAANGWNGLFNADQWNSFYAAVRGVPGPAPETIGFTGTNRNKNMSFAEYWAAMTAGGFSGLGVIAHSVDPYWNNQGTPYGSNLLPNGFETYVVRKGF